jgi:hypothetical protein
VERCVGLTVEVLAGVEGRRSALGGPLYLPSPLAKNSTEDHVLSTSAKITTADHCSSNFKAGVDKGGWHGRP